LGRKGGLNDGRDGGTLGDGEAFRPKDADGEDASADAGFLVWPLWRWGYRTSGCGVIAVCGKGDFLTLSKFPGHDKKEKKSDNSEEDGYDQKISETSCAVMEAVMEKIGGKSFKKLKKLRKRVATAAGLNSTTTVWTPHVSAFTCSSAENARRERPEFNWPRGGQ
jgi:hypothetical protein